MNLKPHGANQTSLTLPSGIEIFFSYETPVAAYIPEHGFFYTAKFHSRTTVKHVSHWLARNGAGGKAKEQPQEFFDKLTGGKQ